MNPQIPAETVVMIIPYKNNAGYWTNSDFAKQLREKVLPLFIIFHPGCQVERI